MTNNNMVDLLVIYLDCINVYYTRMYEYKTADLPDMVW